MNEESLSELKSLDCYEVKCEKQQAREQFALKIPCLFPVVTILDISLSSVKLLTPVQICIQLLTTVHNSIELLATVHNSIELLTTVHSSIELLATVHSSIELLTIFHRDCAKSACTSGLSFIYDFQILASFPNNFVSICLSVSSSICLSVCLSVASTSSAYPPTCVEVM